MTKLEKSRIALKKGAIGFFGGVVVLLGLVMVPYPGPGWLVVFSGLAILATEFDWAKRVLGFAKGKYDAWQDWLKRQNRSTQLVFWSLTCLVVIVTLYLLNGYGLLNDYLHLGLDWLHSPLPIFQ